MSAPASHGTIPATENAELAALLSAISDAIEALKAWDLTVFQSAVDRQRAICDGLARHSEWRQLPGTAATARKIQRLNHIYDRLLKHSVRWTCTLQTILGGNSFQPRASVHFKA